MAGGFPEKGTSSDCANGSRSVLAAFSLAAAVIQAVAALLLISRTTRICRTRGRRLKYPYGLLERASTFGVECIEELTSFARAPTVELKRGRADGQPSFAARSQPAAGVDQNAPDTAALCDTRSIAIPRVV
jgi:hypothetical protein